MKQKFQEITKCRITGTDRLNSILDLGDQALSGVFPSPENEDPSTAPLQLVVADDPENCNLVQLRHNADINEMYGTTYGYHSSISPMMVSHLRAKYEDIIRHYPPKKGDFVLDIGCNDGTFLNFYENTGVKRFGIDPSSKKFINFFQKDIEVTYDFFSEEKVRRMTGDNQYKIISSIAMFYDLDNPLNFMTDVSNLLTLDGIWVVEIAYLPMMLENLAYDQVMHEHLTYLGLGQMKYMMDKTGLEILDATTNYMNGGSISIIVGKKGGPHTANKCVIEKLLASERPLQDPETYKRFSNRVKTHRDEVRHLLELIKTSGQTVFGYGASTKGNIVMNYCGLTTHELPAISDRNPEKIGLVTPQSRIPIISHDEIRKAKPDYLFVNIWHLRKEVVKFEEEYLANGGKLIFSLPRLHIIHEGNYKNYLAASFHDLSYPL